jgi:hypothetical protein
MDYKETMQMRRDRHKLTVSPNESWFEISKEDLKKEVDKYLSEGGKITKVEHKYLWEQDLDFFTSSATAQ